MKRYSHRNEEVNIDDFIDLLVSLSGAICFKSPRQEEIYFKYTSETVICFKYLYKCCTKVDPFPQEKKREYKKTLPWFFRPLAWVLCVVSMTVSLFFLWAYGIMFGNEKTTQWLTALLSSIFSSVLITQPVKVEPYREEY